MSETPGWKRPRPMTCLADAGELAHTVSRFDREMPASDPGRALLRKWWEWEYLADSAERLGLLEPFRHGVGLGVGIEALIYFFARHCGRIVATDLYSADTSWREARHADFREAVLQAACFPIEPGRLTVENADMRALPVGAASQDFVWSTSSIEHVPTLTGVLDVYAEIIRVLKPGGHALLTTEFCLSEPPYLLPNLNVMDKTILERIFAAIAPWLEPVGPFDLGMDWSNPANGAASRRYLKPGMVPALHDTRFDGLKMGQVTNPVGISAICPIGFTLRRTDRPAAALPALREIGLPDAVRDFTLALDCYHAGENGQAAAALLSIAADTAHSLQFRLHAFRFGIDAELRGGMETARAATSILDFLGGMPARARDDGDCSDLFSYVLRNAGRAQEGMLVARAGALSASTTWDHALRLAARAECCVPSQDDLLAAVAGDLILAGWPSATVIAQTREAGRLESMDGGAIAATVARVAAYVSARAARAEGA